MIAIWCLDPVGKVHWYAIEGPENLEELQNFILTHQFVECQKLESKFPRVLAPEGLAERVTLVNFNNMVEIQGAVIPVVTRAEFIALEEICEGCGNYMVCAHMGLYKRGNHVPCLNLTERERKKSWSDKLLDFFKKKE